MVKGTSRLDGELKRQEILDAIASLTIVHGRPPTMRELTATTSCRSTGHVSYHLNILAARGDLIRQAGSARSYALARRVGDCCPQCAALSHETATLRATVALLQAQLQVAS
jgi:SOS-response transcriptional repressor LexA